MKRHLKQLNHTMASIGINYEQWMSNLPDRVTEMPFNWIAIPGSHDSAAYRFEPGLGVSVGEPQLVQLFGKTGCGKRVVSNWSKTQALSLVQQLTSGVRYFDFRVAVHPKTNELRFVHGLYGELVSKALSDINSFLDANSKEVVVLDFNHFYNMNAFDHQMLLTEICDTFKQKCIPMNTHNSKLTFTTLKVLWKTQHRVIIFYHNSEVSNFYPRVWDGKFIPSPWANTDNSTKLIQFLENNYETSQVRGDNMYVWQGVETPRTKDVAFHLWSSLEAYLAAGATKTFVKWLKDGKCPGPKGINICIADFVEQHEYISSVIGLNYDIQ